MNNFWNKFIYNIGASFYDKFFNSGVFLKARKEIFKDFHLDERLKILFVGVGTGADIELINYAYHNITAIDYSPNMLEKAQVKFQNSNIQFLEMDAQNMTFDNESFDLIIASLILSVVPDASMCFKEMERVLNQHGTIVVFDKFAPTNKKLALPKILLRPFISLLGTDIGRSFEEIIAQKSNNIKVVQDEPVMLNGMYRKIVLSKV
ncbi:class I SAM-dependent methyltransferase [Solibacillus sp. CAU 1738]|uniref:class I SAM-dependent methyltransferase n=1 Tax=Solibacillus sp. CAU 1738 TaxID=3140363 RepID=UPI00326167BB